MDALFAENANEDSSSSSEDEDQLMMDFIFTDNQSEDDMALMFFAILAFDVLDEDSRKVMRLLRTERSSRISLLPIANLSITMRVP